MAIRHDEQMIVNGRLTQVGFSFRCGFKKTFSRSAVFECQCGKRKIVLLESVKNGSSASCGCLRSEQLAERSKGNTTGRKHNQSGSGSNKRTGAYKTWTAMKRRCNPSNRDPQARCYRNGISVCEKWNVFESFYQDMGDRPDGCTIDRIDGDLGYFKENCRWATYREQARNRRTNSTLTIRGTTKLKVEWAEEPGAVQVETMNYRLRHGVEPEEAVFGKRKR